MCITNRNKKLTVGALLSSWAALESLLSRHTSAQLTGHTAEESGEKTGYKCSSQTDLLSWLLCLLLN